MLLYFLITRRGTGANEEITGWADTEQLADARLGPQGHKRAQEDE